MGLGRCRARSTAPAAARAAKPAPSSAAGHTAGCGSRQATPGGRRARRRTREPMPRLKPSRLPTSAAPSTPAPASTVAKASPCTSPKAAATSDSRPGNRGRTSCAAETRMDRAMSTSTGRLGRRSTPRAAAAIVTRVPHRRPSRCGRCPEAASQRVRLAPATDARQQERGQEQHEQEEQVGRPFRDVPRTHLHDRDELLPPRSGRSRDGQLKVLMVQHARQLGGLAHQSVAKVMAHGHQRLVVTTCPRMTVLRRVKRRADTPSGGSGAHTPRSSPSSTRSTPASTRVKVKGLPSGARAERFCSMYRRTSSGCVWTYGRGAASKERVTPSTS